MIVKSLTSVEIEITELPKSHQHITKLQSELIKEKKLIDLKLDEAIVKQCYLEKKLKYQLLPKVMQINVSNTSYLPPIICAYNMGAPKASLLSI